MKSKDEQRSRPDDVGSGVIDRLSLDLNKSLPQIGGFSARNSRYMNCFAGDWPDVSMLQRSVAALPWSHRNAVIEKLEDTQSCLCHAGVAVESGCSRDILVHRIGLRLNGRSGSAITINEPLLHDRTDLS